MNVWRQLMSFSACVFLAGLPPVALAEAPEPDVDATATEEIPAAPVAEETPAAPAAEEIPDVPRGPRVTVRLMRANGDVMPLPGVDVRRDRYRKGAGMERQEDLISGWVGRTDGQGVVRFEQQAELGPGESDRFSVTWEGFEWGEESAETGPDGSRVLTVPEVRVDASALRMGLQAAIEIRDSNFMIQQRFTLNNRSLTAIDFTTGPGLRIPLLVHEVFGAPLNAGYLPTRPDTRMSRFDLTPARGRLSVEKGALVFRGVVLPGRGQEIRASFAVPYARDHHHRLALSPPVDLEELSVSVTSPETSGLISALAAPHRTLERASGQGRELWHLPLELPKAGEALTVILSHTPDRLRVLRRVALGLGGGILFVISAIFFATRRRP